MSNKLDAFFKSFSDSEEQLDFRMAHETVGQKVPAISSGSLLLDDALSSGGLPKGRLIQFYGAPGSGKTLMAMIAIKEAQIDDPSAQQVFIDAEQTFDPTWAASLGLDTSKIIIIEGDTAVNGRKCFEMVLGVPKEDAKTHILKGKSKEGLLDKVTSGEFNINLVVLDSLGSIIPPGEDVSAVGKMNMALLARFLTTTFRKLSLEVNKAKVPFIIINHKKANMDPYASDHTYSGGNTYAHFLSANVYFEPVNRADARILDEKENKIGQTIRATIEKSKFGPWPRKCEFKIDFGIGVIDRHIEIAQLAIDYEVVTKPSTVTHEYGERKWVGFSKFCDAINDDDDLAFELETKISEARDTKWERKRAEQEAIKNKLAEPSEESSEESSNESEPKKRGRKAKS
jgi:recombination protein RecA